MKALLAFDLDDTLYPEVEFVLSGLKAVSSFMGLRTGLEPGEVLAEAKRFLSARGRAGVLDHLLASFPSARGRVSLAELLYVYRSHCPRIDLADEVAGILERMSPHFHLAVITDGCVVTQLSKVRALGLDKIVDRVIYTDVLGREYWKPSSFAYEMLRRDFEPRGGCWYVGDNPRKDFAGAKEAAFGTVMLKNSWNEDILKSVPPDFRPDVIVSSLAELPSVLGVGCTDAVTEDCT